MSILFTGCDFWLSFSPGRVRDDKSRRPWGRFPEYCGNHRPVWALWEGFMKDPGYIRTHWLSRPGFSSTLTFHLATETQISMGANLEQVARIHFQEPESDFRFTEVLEPLDSFQRAECPCRLDPVPLPSSFPSNIRAGLLYIYFTEWNRSTNRFTNYYTSWDLRQVLSFLQSVLLMDKTEIFMN